MVRPRLATLTLAGSLLVSASGCCGGMMSDSFSRWRAGSNVGAATSADCTCHEMSGVYGGTVPTGVEMQATPTLVPPEATFTPPPGSTVPIGPPPRIVPVPATPTPWTGHHHHR